MGYTLLLGLIEYKTLVMRGDLDRANEILPTIPKEHRNRYILYVGMYIIAYRHESVSSIFQRFLFFPYHAELH